jgi:hypothetical protein
MRLSVSAARNGALVINIVLTAARRASVWVVFIFIIFLLSFVVFLASDTGDTLPDVPAHGYGV